MSLITTAEVISRFPQYQKYFLDESGDYDVTVLQADIDDAEDLLAEHITVTAALLTDQIKLQIIAVVKYLGFNRRHGDTEFDNTPQIVKDYNAIIKKWESYKGQTQSPAGNTLDPTDDVIDMNAKTRRFKGDAGWFNNTTYDLTDTES